MMAGSELRWVAHMRGRALHALGRVREQDVPPSPREMREAQSMLASSRRPASFGELGGFRPDKTNRTASWWGGNFAGGPGETAPAGRTGQPMQPLLQLRASEVPIPLPGLENVALLALWIDMRDGDLFDAAEGEDFVVRTYEAIEGLLPLGPGYREGDGLLSFPVRWREPVAEQPSWDDFADRVPRRVAWQRGSAWFHDTDANRQTSAMQAECPIKIGGWPTWIQASQWESTQDRETFVLQVDSTPKGGIRFGDAGSIYLFLDRAGSWKLRCDFF